jgi:hypothetical protein
MDISLPRLSVVHLRRRGSVVAALVVIAVFLELAAGTGLAYLAGWFTVRAVLGDINWIWLAVLVGALLISFVGYYFAYQGIFRVEGGPGLPRRDMYAVVAAGFGGFLAHGGGALDQYALQTAGADEQQAKVRVAGRAGLEHGVMSIGGTVAAIVVLASGSGSPARRSARSSGWGSPRTTRRRSRSRSTTRDSRPSTPTPRARSGPSR